MKMFWNTASLLWRLAAISVACLAVAVAVEDPFDSPFAHQVMRLSKSAEMRNYMKPGIEACDDFYTYACGNWARINPAHAEVKTNIFNILSKAYNRKVLKILGRGKESNDTETERKVKYFYESCLQRDSIRRNYRENLMSIMEEFGGMPALKGAAWHEPSFNWLEVIAQILRKYGKKIIINADINADLNNNEFNRLYIGQMDDMVPGSSKEFYARLAMAWQMDLQKVLGLSPTVALITAREMAEFAQKLAMGMADPLEGLGMEDKTRLRLLETMTENYGPVLNFTLYVNTWLGYNYILPVYEYVDNYLRNMRLVILETPTTTVANYIMWQLIQDFRLDVEGSDERQQKKCIEATRKYFPKYLDNLIYQDLLKSDPDIIEEVNDIWKHLKTSFHDILNGTGTEWMQDNTRDKALEKLSAMTFEINSYSDVDFSKELGPLVISSNQYFENVINILKLRGQNYRLKIEEPPRLEEYELLSFTPAYAAEYNRVLLPVAFLQPRFLWDDVYPKALKYGTVGFTIAHEMAHGFDDTIRKYDAKGNLNNWWDRNASITFEVRKECLRQQYGSHKFGGRFLPKAQAQGENIADNVGIRIAYQAYDRWLEQHHQTPEHLPNMDTITARQLFFISTAQLWCTDVNRRWRQLVTTTDVHPPEEVRVRAMLANFEEFAETFSCKHGTQMNPQRKCIIY
ncbi:endothelin-converting enzyme 2-like [Musca vetustissima]|uniref:endothelin-converting enzyme 2-like n=1 Tax=Musca vetustissima TaxID=27455 RepID=UPI002AB76C4D|nr:endothelin-converting enzyme 2-like [Musca vetustissima]